MQRRGFTLIELLVVITVMAILLGMLIPAIGLVRAQAKKTKTVNLLNQVSAALESYRTTKGWYPEPTKAESNDWLHSPISTFPDPQPQLYDGNLSDTANAPAANFAGVEMAARLLPKALEFSNRDDFKEPLPLDSYGTPLRYLPARCYPPSGGNNTTYPGKMPRQDSYILWSAGPDALDNALEAGPYTGMPMGGGDDIADWNK